MGTQHPFLTLTQPACSSFIFSDTLWRDPPLSHVVSAQLHKFVSHCICHLALSYYFFQHLCVFLFVQHVFHNHIHTTMPLHKSTIFILHLQLVIILVLLTITVPYTFHVLTNPFPCSFLALILFSFTFIMNIQSRYPSSLPYPHSISHAYCIKGIPVSQHIAS